jgi:hypothetical protein
MDPPVVILNKAKKPKVVPADGLERPLRLRPLRVACPERSEGLRVTRS